MCRKLIGTVVIVTGIGTILCLAGGPFKYARTWVTSQVQTAEKNVPIDLKIQHARAEVEKLGPDVRKCMHVIAEQQVDVEQLESQIAQRQERLTEQEFAILKLRNDLKRNDVSYVYAGRNYSPTEVRSDLKIRFERFKGAKKSLERQRKILTARKKAVTANEKRLNEMLAAKDQLELQIEQLEARWKTMQAEQVTSELEFDDSQLSQTKVLLRKLNRELDVRDKLLSEEGKLTGNIPVETKPIDINKVDVTTDVDSYFNLNQSAGPEIVKTEK